MKKLIQEFKDFALRGNVFDLAIGVVIGSAFTAIVNSVVTDIFTPFLSLIMNTSNLEKLHWVLKPEVSLGEEIISEAIVLNYGNFLDSLISFLVIAIVLFLFIKAYNNLLRSRPETPVEESAPALSKEAELLEQIYHELRKK